MQTRPNAIDVQQYCAVELIDKSCLICNKSLSKSSNINTQFPVLSTHTNTQPNPKDKGKGKDTGHRLATLPEKAPLSNADRSFRQTGRSHLFHTDCLIEYAGKSIACSGAITQTGISFRCPSCDKGVNLRSITPFCDPLLEPTSSDIEAFRDKLGVSILDAARATAVATNTSERSPLLPNNREITRSSRSNNLTFYGQEPLINFNQSATTAAAPTTERLSADQGKKIGAALLLTSIASGLLHAPAAVILLTASLGSSYLRSAALEDCANADTNANANANNGTADRENNVSDHIRRWPLAK